mmetsp:Transcript_7463/g.26128  ORF Transcript_7463/g.26128 Transcript_7463/m.26128 type:complete len:455 (+) Transcript_7463:161-1525(+)
MPLLCCGASAAVNGNQRAEARVDASAAAAFAPASDASVASSGAPLPGAAPPLVALLLDPTVLSQFGETSFLPCPARGDTPAESMAMTAEEMVEAGKLKALLSPAALQTLEAYDVWFGAMRFVRGYWLYADRLEEMSRAVEQLHIMRQKFRIDLFTSGDAVRFEECRSSLKCWGGIELCGFDSFGHAVIVENAMETVQSLIAAKDVDCVLEQRAVCSEMLQVLKMAATHRGSGVVLKHVYVVDMTNIRFSMFSGKVRSSLRNLCIMLEGSYPECVWCTYVVNAPSALLLIWSVIKRWMHASTTEKVVILGCNANDIRQRLLSDNVPKHAIPLCCGGSASGVKLADLLRNAPGPAEEDAIRATAPRGQGISAATVCVAATAATACVTTAGTAAAVVAATALETRATRRPSCLVALLMLQALLAAALASFRHAAEATGVVSVAVGLLQRASEAGVPR